jgi:hypothetical protein
MQSRLIVDEPRPEEDAALMAALARIASMNPPGSVQMVFGVEGSDRRIYRLIEIQSLVEAVNVIAAIRQLGLSGAPGRRAHGVLLQRVFTPAKPQEPGTR